MQFPRRQAVVSHVDVEKNAVFSVVTTPYRPHVVLRLPSGAKLMAWPNMPPYLRLGELGIPGARASYKVLKHSEVIDDRDTVWKEGEALTVELTMVKCCGQHFLSHIYVCVRIDNGHTAYRLPGCPVNVPAVTHKVPARDGL